jgi:3-deoxy-manno-octulosonate cytidylyltransferase (CMP-KDO synthetase)
MKLIGVIPARYASTRFPGKPLALIAGKPLLQHVIERCKGARFLDEVIVATDDQRIRDLAIKFCRVEMTSPDHPTGTDRIAEVVQRTQVDGAINIQGDEPLIDPAVIDSVANALGNAPMSTAAAPVNDVHEYDNPNVVKVVVNAMDRALYFSRRTIHHTVRPRCRQPFCDGAIGGVSFFEAPWHLRVSARDVAAIGEVSDVAARAGGEAGTIEGAGERD